MENNKKSFILHLDSLDVLDDLDDKNIAELFKAIRDYNINGETNLEGIMKAVFNPFKNQFDRDFEKYNGIVERNKLNGSKGGRPSKKKNIEEPKKPNGLFKEPKKADSDSDSDSDSVSDNENVNESDILLKKETKNNKRFSFKKNLVEYGFREDLVDDWLQVRKTKKATNTETAFNAFINEIESKNCNINDMLQIAVTNSWSGFKHKWVENLKNTNTNGSRNNNTQSTDSDHKESAVNAVNAMFGR